MQFSTATISQSQASTVRFKWNMAKRLAFSARLITLSFAMLSSAKLNISVKAPQIQTLPPWWAEWKIHMSSTALIILALASLPFLTVQTHISYMERTIFQAQMLEQTSHLVPPRVEDILSASTLMAVLTMIFVEKMEFIRFTKVCQSLS